MGSSTNVLLGLRENPEVSGLTIYQETPGCYRISVRHTGLFNLGDYEEIDLDVRSARLVKR